MPSNLPVRWEMPVLQPGHVVVDLGKAEGQTSWSFGPDQDVLFLGAPTPRTADRIYVKGGNDIVILGGKYVPSGGHSATIHLNGPTGTVYIEGVHIDHADAPPKDGIGIAGAPGYDPPDVIIQNTIVDGITGAFKGVHGDIFQRYGTLGDVKIYNLSGSTNYQGLFLNPHPGYEIRSVELENVDIAKLPGGDARTWTYYFYSPGDNLPFPVKLTNVYSSDAHVFPPPGYREGAAISAGKITFPNPALTGAISVGAPPGGDFVKPGDVGVGYRPGPLLKGPVKGSALDCVVGQVDLAGDCAAVGLDLG